MIPFDFRKIETAEFAISYDDLDAWKEIETDLSFGFAANHNHHTIVVATILKVLKKGSKDTVFNMRCHHYFEFDGEFWADRFSGNKLVLEKDYLINITMISLGVFRGMLHSKSINTPLSGFILPFVNLHETILEDHTFDFTPESQ